MKTNLDKFYKTNQTLEKQGIWIMVSDETGFKIRRFGGANSDKLKMALAKYYKPYSRQVEKGTLSTEKENEITTKSFIETSMIDWKGVEIDGEEKPYDPSLAFDFFIQLPELLEELLKQSQIVDNFKEELGNF